MSKFQAGDTVRLKENKRRYTGLYGGELGEILPEKHGAKGWLIVLVGGHKYGMLEDDSDWELDERKLEDVIMNIVNEITEGLE